MDKTQRHNRFTYANIMSTIALLVALGGGTAFAISIKSQDIINGSIKALDIKEKTLTEGQIKKKSLTHESIKKQSLTGAEIKKESLSGNHLKKGTLQSEHIKEQSLKGSLLKSGAIKSQQLHGSVTQILVARINELGGAATIHGSISGTSEAANSFGVVSMMLPQSRTFTRMTVNMASAVPLNNERIFTLGGIKGDKLTCTMEEAASCVATGSATFGAGQPIAIQVQSTGGALDPTQDASVGLSLKL